MTARKVIGAPNPVVLKEFGTVGPRLDNRQHITYRMPQGEKYTYHRGMIMGIYGDGPVMIYIIRPRFQSGRIYECFGLQETEIAV